MVENSRRKTHPHLTPVGSPGVLPNVRRVPSPWICSKALPHAQFQTPVFNKWTGEATFSSAVTHGFPAIDHCTCLSLFSRALSPQPFLTPHPSPWPPAQCTSLLQACSEFSLSFHCYPMNHIPPLFSVPIHVVWAHILRGQPLWLLLLLDTSAFSVIFVSLSLGPAQALAHGA